MTTESAIRKVIGAWGVDDKDRVEAIRLILNGSDPDKIVSTVEEVSRGLGALEALKPDTSST
ncbi:MAG: hypothetical protein WC845_01095 [Candidatus Staskawiczbacteria bacterium]|jgi:hypothetical protein